MSSKRISVEINKRFPEVMNKLGLSFELNQFEPDRQKKELSIYSSINNKEFLQFTIPSDYPFKPPSVFVIENYYNTGPYFKYNSIPYHKWSVSIMDLNRFGYKPIVNCDYFIAWVFSIIRRPYLAYIWKFIPSNNIKENPCLCCESILCSNKWGPGVLISDILLEYIGRKDFNVNCSRLMQRWIKPIFDNEKWILPAEIILIIIEMVKLPGKI